MRAIHQQYVEFLNRLPTTVTAYPDVLYRAMAETVYSELGVSAAAVCHSRSAFDRVYEPGDRVAVMTVIKHVALPRDDALSWEQVLEFRHDSESCRHFRAPVHWLDGDMKGQSISFIQDEVAPRLDKYERALKKHGISTIIGSLTSLLDSRFLVGSSAAVAAAAVAGPPEAGLVTGAGLAIGKASLHLAKALLSYDEVKYGPGQEIALIHEIRTAVD